MSRFRSLLAGLALISLNVTFSIAQEAYVFKKTIDLEATPVKSQDNTGTCWSYSTHSFLESELIRMGKGELDLSEMYHARLIYEDKASNYVRRQGKAQFGQGSLAHDVLRMVAAHGVVPDSVYPGLLKGATAHNHTELEAVLLSVVKTVTEQGGPSVYWKDAVSGILDAYLGAKPSQFTWKGKTYTPRSFADALGIEPENYVSLTSFTHHPFRSWFVLEVADNYSNGQFWNVPLDDLVRATDEALENGYTLAWDADVSERSFVASKGIAILPAESWSGKTRLQAEQALSSHVPELTVTQQNRQAAFDAQETTDDHLMHITGKAVDASGNPYYVVKNSWGTDSGKDGYMYVSLAYFKMKTLSVTVHRSALPKDISKELK